ncbi:MAG: Rpn family recombination-promoting nuclease/putative transposase [Verrucomicrobia bacterium]|nr:Rpn family recombination-promoting nuclease/putative transposase [Verrucomicrobiota bacterium]
MAKISQEQYAEYRRALKRMRMMDDTLMKCVFKDCKPAVELTLRIIMQRNDLDVKRFSVSKEYKNLKGHSICLDVLAEDKDSKQYNIEVQRDSKGASPQRTRFYNAMVDVEMLGKGEDYSELRDNYTIFITEEDIFKKGKPFYLFERVDRESGEPLGDGSHIIYVNGSYDGDDPLGWLMRDFREPDPAKMHYKVFAERVNYLKNITKGEKEMCQIMEEIREKGFQKGIQKGIQKGRLEGRQEGRLEGIQISVRLCRQFGLSDEQIVEQIATEYHLSKKEAAKYVYAE